MIFSLFRRKPAQEPLDLHNAIVAQSRQPAFYQQGVAPDTIEGRFEMLALHAFLFFERCKLDPVLKDISQEVVDRMFTELDRALREIGVSDISVPKKMKKLAKHVYGRFAAYGAAVSSNDVAAFSAVLSRNLHGDDADPLAAEALARYAFAALAHLQEQPATDILAGKLSFPAP